MNAAIIGVGSNIDPEKNIEAARRVLARRFRLIGESEFVRTKPIGLLDQPDFINGVFHIATELGCEELKEMLKEIEIELGRVKSPVKYGPRTIDLDIVAWNGKVVNNDFHEREFVRKAAFQVSPNLTF